MGGGPPACLPPKLPGPQMNSLVGVSVSDPATGFRVQGLALLVLPLRRALVPSFPRPTRATGIFPPKTLNPKA